LFNIPEIIIKQEEVWNWLLNEQLNVFLTAVRAPSERAVGLASHIS